MKNNSLLSAEYPTRTYDFDKNDDQEKLLPGKLFQVKLLKLCVALISFSFLVAILLS